jgi:hypothetical protein
LTKSLIIVCVLLFPFLSISQDSNESAVLMAESEAISELDELKLRFGANKILDSAIELSFYTAISFMSDDLTLTHIKVKESKINTSLSARPTVLSLLFRKREHRKYIIRINDHEEGRIPLFKHASFNAQVGVLGHEISHIVDYNQRSFGGIINRMFDYSSKDRKTSYEQEIDSMTIWSGLGWQLKEWMAFVQESPVATEEYKAFKRDIYYTQPEIEGKIDEFENGSLKE